MFRFVTLIFFAQSNPMKRDCQRTPFLYSPTNATWAHNDDFLAFTVNRERRRLDFDERFEAFLFPPLVSFFIVGESRGEEVLSSSLSLWERARGEGTRFLNLYFYGRTS